jgi:site-specific DNA-methyltransferase (adenine-specific)
LKYYLDQSPGVPLDDFWDDIDLISSSSNESVRYPTQKPEALLERIIAATTNEGDVVLDPFCGCGTAIVTAQKLKRRWIGVDVTYLAMAVIKSRFAKDFGMEVFKDITVIGEPVNVDEGIALARDDKFGFQYWAAGKLGAPPIEYRKGADQGVDGRIRFFDDGGSAKQIIISVKAGEHVGPAFVRELRGVVEREKAEMGILVCVKSPTSEMTREARRAGTYSSLNASFPKLQIVTVADMFADKPLNIPGRVFDPYQRKKPTSVKIAPEQLRLLP